MSVVEQCIALDLFDTDIPRLTVSSRSFSRKENDQKKTFWRQSINAVAFNWLHVYKNLRARIKPESYHEGTDVLRIHKQGASFISKLQQVKIIRLILLLRLMVLIRQFGSNFYQT